MPAEISVPFAGVPATWSKNVSGIRPDDFNAPIANVNNGDANRNWNNRDNANDNVRVRPAAGKLVQTLQPTAGHPADILQGGLGLEEFSFIG